MLRYSQFAPTALDPYGAFLPDRQDWFVGPSRTRDSECLQESNFAVALASLGGECAAVEVHQFSHWAAGWFEIILVDPADADKVEMLAEIESRLADDPVLGPEDLAARESSRSAAAGSCQE